MEGYLPGLECAQCKGKCCKEKGCSLSPEDMWMALAKRKEEMAQNDWKNKQQEFEEIIKKDSLKEEQEKASFAMKSQILSLLQDPEGKFTIDYFSTEKGPLFYLRMRHKCYTFIGVDAMGECVALTKNGCSLSEEERPKGGRFLKSAPDRRCVQHYTREMMQQDWEPYCGVLKNIWKEYEAKLKEDGTFDKCDADYFAWMKTQRENAVEI